VPSRVAVPGPSCYTVRVAVAASLGALWGLLGYALLWGLTPVVVHRTFVVSFPGTVALLPVRIVLAGIRLVEERLFGRPLQLAENNEWIGILSAAVGAGIASIAFLGIRVVARRLRPERQPSGIGL
jgi:energy-converting hydrogenase Eha subunit A